jgi:hypothetical protein
MNKAASGELQAASELISSDGPPSDDISYVSLKIVKSRRSDDYQASLLFFT